MDLITDCIGATPLLELTGLIPCPAARIFAKAELWNPGGSIKDRTALAMVEDAEFRGVLHPGGTIIEPTSGNTGIALAMLGAARGYRVIIVMPDSMTPERRYLMEAYGAEVVMTPGSQGMTGAITRAQELARKIPDSFLPDQFSNPANAMAHYETTGPEIWAQSNEQVDIFVAGVGTGGTLTGAGRFLKTKNPRLKIVAVEPATSAVLSGKEPGKHNIQGIGAGFVPGVLDVALIDEVIPVSDTDAMDTARQLAHVEGIFAGPSSGAAVYAAGSLAQRPENRGKTIVTILPDSGSRYLSQKA